MIIMILTLIIIYNSVYTEFRIKSSLPKCSTSDVLELNTKQIVQRFKLKPQVLCVLNTHET